MVAVVILDVDARDSLSRPVGQITGSRNMVDSQYIKCKNQWKMSPQSIVFLSVMCCLLTFTICHLSTYLVFFEAH